MLLIYILSPQEVPWNEGSSEASLMEFQGGQGRARRKARKTRGPSKALGGLPPFLFHLSLVLLAFLLALPWPPWTSSSYIAFRKALLESPQKAKGQIIRCHPAQVQLLETIQNSCTHHISSV